MTLPHRDSVVWTVGIIGGACLGLAGHFDLFPWIPKQVQNWVELIAFLYAGYSAKMATSPAPAPPKP